MPQETNSKYINFIKKVLSNCNPNKYIVLGSAATLSYTKQFGYSRKMHDLDVIIDATQMGIFTDYLRKNKFKQSTFIHSRMPFYTKLLKHSASMYLRYFKDHTYIEVLVTTFIENEGRISFQLYPNIWIEIPAELLRETRLGGARFTSLSVHLVWAVKQILHNTLGAVMRYKSEQRSRDLTYLKRAVDVQKARTDIRRVRFGYNHIRWRLPVLFVVMFLRYSR